MAAAVAPAKQEKMSAVLPFTLDPKKMGLHDMRLVNPGNPHATAPTVTVKEQKRVQHGILKGWSIEAAKAYVSAPKPIRTMDFSWSDREVYWEENVQNCCSPEEVEALLPAKWIGYRVETEVDDSLTRVCRLCTALVDRFVAMSTQPEEAPKTTSKWREQQKLKVRIQAVTELLEASIGEAVPVLRLRENRFMRQTWGQLQDDERHSMLAALDGAEDDATEGSFVSAEFEHGEDGEMPHPVFGFDRRAHTDAMPGVNLPAGAAEEAEHAWMDEMGDFPMMR